MELPEPDPDRDLDRYESAAELFATWQDTGVLRRDPSPCFYGYKMTFTSESGEPRSTTGLLGALEVVDSGSGGVLPHEHTMAKPKSDRLDLLRATEVNTSPVWGLSLAPGLTAAAGRPPTAEDEAGSDLPGGYARATDGEGVIHECWPITDPVAIRDITSIVAANPVVLADGHHRYETARAYRDERRLTAGITGRVDPLAEPAPYDLVMAFVIELSDDQCEVRPIHRLISSLPSGTDLPALLEPFFHLTDAGAPTEENLASLSARGDLTLLTMHHAWVLTPLPATLRAAEAATGIPGLDSAAIAVALDSLPNHQLSYQHGFDQATRAVLEGPADAAFLLRPVSVEQIAGAARAGRKMPPKSTFFHPKPRTGFVYRPLRERYSL